MISVYAEWPELLRHHADSEPWLENQARSAGRTFTGQERIVGSDAGFWRYQITTMAWGPEQIVLWRHLMAQVEGRLGVIRMPIWDQRQDVVALSGLESVRQAIPAAGIPYEGVDGDALHAENVGFAADLSSSVVINAVAARATSLRTILPLGMTPYPGQHFSDRRRLYRIKSATLVSGTTYDLTFLPTLRDPIASGAEISFDQLFCLMRLADETAQNIARDPTWALRWPLDLVEAFA